MNTTLYLEELIALNQNNRKAAQYLLDQPDGAIYRRPNSEAWNAVECIAHLNRYASFYIPTIVEKLSNQPEKQVNEVKHGWFGKWSIGSMGPKEDNRDELGKMNTFKSMNTLGGDFNNRTIHQYIRHTEDWEDLLKRAHKYDLNRIKVPTTLGKLVQMRLGDILKFVLTHEKRHLIQAHEAVIV